MDLASSDTVTCPFISTSALRKRSSQSRLFAMDPVRVYTGNNISFSCAISMYYNRLDACPSAIIDHIDQDTDGKIRRKNVMYSSNRQNNSLLVLCLKVINFDYRPVTYIQLPIYTLTSLHSDLHIHWNYIQWPPYSVTSMHSDLHTK